MADQAQQKPEWMTDEGRRPWVTNSLKARRDELFRAAARCRKAYNKNYMGEPARWLGDAYDEAAIVLDRKLREIEVIRVNG